MAVMGLGLAGAGVKAAGDYESGQATAEAMNYKAQVAQANARFATQEGEEKATNQGLKARAQIGSIKAAQAANNVDVNSGSAADVRTSAESLEMLDSLNIRSNAARAAYGYQTQSTLDEYQAKQAKTAGGIGMVGDLLSGVSSTGISAYKLSLGTTPA